jgi:hypothetical protein
VLAPRCSTREQEIAVVSRCGIDAGQHRHCALEDLIVQARTNAGQVLAAVDDTRLLRGQLEHAMNGTDTDGHAQQVRNSTTPRYELRQISVSATITWRSHVLVTVNWNSTSSSGTADEKASSNAMRALSVCWYTNLRLTV